MDSGTQSTQSNIWITGFSPDGYKVSLTLTITSVADALRCIQEVRACGITPYAPEAKPGEVRETVDVCVYRVYTGNDGKEKFVVDVYRERAQYRTLSIYFDNDADVTAFENQAGRSIDEFKVYNSQAPLQRNIDRPTKHELNVRPFEIIKSPDKEKEIGGVMRMVYRFGGYANPLTVSPTMSKDDRKPTASANGQQQKKAQTGAHWTDDERNR